MSTFKRASSAANLTIAGTKPSVHNGQLLISSGLADLDTHLGGGIPLGSLILLFEDTASNYSNHILNYYISEGVSCKHNIVYMGIPNDLENALPLNYTKFQQQQQQQQQQSSNEKKDESHAPKETSSVDLKISWRYEQFVQEQIALKQQAMKNRTVNASGSSSSGSSSKKVGSVQCHEYDLSKTIQTELIQEARQNGHLFELGPSSRGKLFQILQQVKKQAMGNLNQVTRVAIRSIHMQLDREDSQHFNSISQFFHLLKVLCRKSLTTAFVTIPKNHSNIALVQSIKNCCDIVMRMDSFIGEHINVSAWEMSEYTGLYHIEKLPRMNTLSPYLPDTLNYAFKMKKRKMYIEKMSAPPEESRSATVKDRPRYLVEEKSSSIGCGSSTGSSKNSDLDF